LAAICSAITLHVARSKSHPNRKSMKGNSMAKLLPGKRKVYVASSWRNLLQPGVVAAIRSLGHDVYDFKSPTPGDEGFHWSEIDGGWKTWDAETYIKSLEHPIAERGFSSDFAAMQWADTFVLVQPCGRSAHLEMGWACGQGKATIMMLAEEIEPELMAKMCDHICKDLGEVLELFQDFSPHRMEAIDGWNDEREFES